MVTADSERSGRHRGRLLAAGFVVAVAVALIAQVALDDDKSVAPPETAPTPIAVEATSVYQFTTLEEMTAASDVIVVGTVIATERGRLVGDPDSGGVISRIVTIRVESNVLPSGVDERASGAEGAVGATVIVEEEGFLPDGTPIIVNGVAPSEVGDRGIWFLDSLDDAEIPAFLVINSQGRYLVDGAQLRGGDQRDPLVQSLQQLSLDQLVDRTRAIIAG